MYVFVAGPVPRAPSNLRTRRATKLYDQLKIIGTELDMSMMIPYLDVQLDGLSSKEFFNAIRERITSAAGMIGVIFDGDQSVPAEAAIAAAAGVDLALLCSNGARLPRMLQDLSVQSVIIRDDFLNLKITAVNVQPRTRESVKEFVQTLRPLTASV